MQKGDIFWGRKGTGIDPEHPIVFWGSYSAEYFLGLMLTHHRSWRNIDLSNPNFFSFDPSKFTDSNFVKAVLVKPVDWLDGRVPFDTLTPAGIAYIENIALGLKPVKWTQYINQQQYLSKIRRMKSKKIS